jgi:hypothetical protein
MKKYSRVVVAVAAACLMGVTGQLNAFGATTNSVWSLTSLSSFSAGSLHFTETNPATAVFLSDGTCSLLVGANAISGNYTSNTKQVTLTLTADGLVALETNAVEIVQTRVPPEVSLKIKSGKFSSKIALKNGVPVSTTDTVSGTGSETEGSKTKSKNFSLKTLWTDWTLTSGANF